MAGGTDLLVDMKNGRIKPKYLISIMKIPGLNHIIENEEGLRIGARTTFQEIEESQLVKDKYKLIIEAVESLGTVQTRNMSTIGGNICNALPSADMPPALVALDAKVKIVSKNGERILPLVEFFSGMGLIEWRDRLFKLLMEFFAHGDRVEGIPVDGAEKIVGHPFFIHPLDQGTVGSRPDHPPHCHEGHCAVPATPDDPLVGLLAKTASKEERSDSPGKNSV